MLLRPQIPKNESNRKTPIEIDQDTELWAEVTGFVRTEQEEEWTLNAEGIQFADPGEFESLILLKRDDIFTLRCFCGFFDRQVEFSVEDSDISIVPDYHCPLIPSRKRESDDCQARATY